MTTAGIALHRGPHPITDRMRAAVRLVEEGASRREVARLYGVSRTAVHEWIAKIEDERRLAR